MRRRRSFLRPRIGRPIARNMLANDAQIALQEAHDLMGQGEFQKAATIFDRLAAGVLRRGFVGRAPFLFVQAGRAYYLGGNTKNGEEKVIQGLTLLAQQKHWRVLKNVSQRIIQEFNQSEKPEIATRIETWIQKNIPANIAATLAQSSQTPQSPAKLPPKCPYCGATVSPREVDWLDDQTAACIYCGSVLQG
jgi:hypothetical protein